MTLKLPFILAWAGLLAGAGVHAAEPPLTEPAYQAAKKKIATQYKADRRTCDRLKGRAQDVCELQAKGREKADSAWLEAKYKPSPEAVQDAKTATAEAHHDIAMERCEARKGKAQSRCEDEAEAALEAAIRQARVEKVEAQREAQARARQAAAKARKAAAAAATGQS